MPGSTPRYTNNDGFLMPMGFPEDALASALTYRAQPSDIFVTTYPKCGTTWAQQIVYLILHDGVPLPADRSLTTAFPHLEEVGRAPIEALPAPRCIKTHLPFAMTPYSRDAKYIYVARNPFDCAVSFYHHTRGFVQHYDFADGSFDDYFECFVAGRVDFGDYFDNLLSWYAHRDDDNLLFLTFEGMKADPAGAIDALGVFLGPPSVRVVRTPETLARIVEHSSFEHMRKDQTRWASERPEGMPAFVRKGIVGDWVNVFSPEQARRLARRFDERTAGTDLGELWPETLKAARAR